MQLSTDNIVNILYFNIHFKILFDNLKFYIVIQIILTLYVIRASKNISLNMPKTTLFTMQ